MIYLYFINFQFVAEHCDLKNFNEVIWLSFLLIVQFHSLSLTNTISFLFQHFLYFSFSHSTLFQGDLFVKIFHNEIIKDDVDKPLPVKRTKRTNTKNKTGKYYRFIFLK